MSESTESIFAVVFESAYKTAVLFQGSKSECKKYLRDNPEMCSTYTFLQELEYA